MRRKSMVAAMLTGMLAAQSILCSGCGRGQSPDMEKGIEEGREPAAEEPLWKAETESAAGGTLNENEDREGGDSALRYQDGANGFAFRLTKEMLTDKEEGQNMILSPYSVWLPLAALANATDTAGREQLLWALGESGADVPALNETVKALNASLMREEYAGWMKENGLEYESPLKIANALFVDQDSEVKREFEEIFGDDYEGRVFSVDFSDASAAEEVNGWALEKTDGRIDNIIDSFDPQTVAAIANAIFFSDSWATEFSESNTSEAVFYGAQEEETVPFMNGKFAEAPYWEDDELQAVGLETAGGGRLIILLPKAGKSAEEILGGLDAEKFERFETAERRTVQLSLPRFRLESEVFSVKEAVERLGVPLCGSQAPLLTGLAEGEALFISDAVQKAVVEVDEKGMTAAAATVIAMARGAMLEEAEPVEVKCDRPFAFLLTAYGGDRGQIVLFSGIVNQIGQN